MEHKVIREWRDEMKSRKEIQKLAKAMPEWREEQIQKAYLRWAIERALKEAS